MTQIVFEHESGLSDLHVTLAEPTATVGDLAVALGVPSEDGLIIGARMAGPDLSLQEAGVHQGVCVRAADATHAAVAQPGPVARPSLALVVRGGLVAGPTWPLPVGETSVGRDPGNDVVLDQGTVSSRHCTLTVDAGGEVTASDLGSRNGTWVDGAPVSGQRIVPLGAMLRLGAVLLSVVATDDHEPCIDIDPRTQVGPCGTIAFNRPPRPASPPAPPPLRLPSAPVPPTPAPLSLVTLVAPLGFAAVMVVVLGRLVYALFALLGPVMALGTWLESRRRSRRSSKRQARELAAQIDELGAACERALRGELARLHAARPHPGLLLRRAAGPSVRLWERRAHHDDFLHLHAGTGDLGWDPPLLEGGDSRPAQVDEALARVSVLRDAPWPVDVSKGGVVGIVGDRAAALAVARSLVCQAATQSGPADPALAVLTDPDRRADWDWAKWLPHTRHPSGADDRRLLSCDPDTSTCLLRSLLSRPKDPVAAPVTMVVIDAEGLTEGRGSPARSVLRGDAGPVAGVVLAPSAQRLPAMCSTVIELDGPDGESALLRPQRGEGLGPFLAAGLEERVARSWARHLARFEDPECPAGDHDVPQSVALTSLLGFDACDPLAVAEAWRDGAAEARTATPLGVSSRGPVALDLAVSPHLRVMGPAGSGKTELLLAAAAGLAVKHGPDTLNLVLLDAAGQGAFSPCAHLPHVVGVAGEAAAAAAVARLAEELGRREEQKASGGAAGRSARLVVMVDDTTALADRHPEAVPALAAMAARGPSVGVHLVVAGEQAAHAVCNQMRGELSIDLERTGRGTVFGDGWATAFQAARVTGGTAAARHGVELAPFVFAPRAGLPTPPSDEEGGVTDLARLVTTAGAAFAAESLPPPPQLWSHLAPMTGDHGVVGLPELIGIADVATIDPGRTWQPPAHAHRLRVPIGVNPDGRALPLDLKESALGGMGPHGVVVGATGSGKSELLRSLVIALAITHHPDQLNFVLVDFKGGATFAGMAELPHVAGMITNLEDDLSLIDRMHDALFGEQRRRQERLRRAGNLASVREHEQLRASGAGLEPLPSLVVIVDEFTELLTSRPDFIDLFTAIGRVGRSLGMHLLLASQRLDEGRLRGLDSHLSYRIALRTFSAAESRAVIGATDAYRLPAAPGGGYLKVGDSVPQRFQAAFVSEPYRQPGPGSPPPGPGPSVLDVAVSRLRHGAEQAHQVWLAPLEPIITLDRVLPPLVQDPERGLVARGWPGVGGLAVPLGLVDKPADQAQHLLVVDLAGAEGNLAVVGAPQSGKSTLLRTLVSALCLTHTPTEVQLYCLDFGGGGLLALGEVPHVGAVAARLQRERARRVVTEVAAVLARRERLFQERGIDSVATFRAMRAAGRLDEEPHGDVFLVIDNWPALRQEWDTAEATVDDIAARGLGFGVHVVVTANQWMDMRHLKDSVSGRLELRLNQPADSAIDRRSAANIAHGAPGRGLTRQGLQFQACLPRADGRPSVDDLQAASADLVTGLRAAWPGPEAPPVRLLPAVLPFTELPEPAADRGRGVPVGIEESALSPVYLDLTGADSHFLVFGDGESGKTAFLKAFLAGLTTRYGPEQASVLVVDYRRGLLDSVHPAHLFGYAGAAPAAAAEVARLRDVLVGRLPGPEVSPRQLRERSWWSGPDLYLVVDDYDLVVTPGANPLAPLLELLAQGRDLGLHVVLARRVAGASRAMFEPVLQRLKELSSPGLILSGEHQEGALIGPHRASEQVPGRGLLVRRKQLPVLVQVAWVPV